MYTSGLSSLSRSKTGGSQNQTRNCHCRRKSRSSLTVLLFAFENKYTYPLNNACDSRLLARSGT